MPAPHTAQMPATIDNDGGTDYWGDGWQDKWWDDHLDEDVWEFLQPLLPLPRRGRPPRNQRQVLAGVLYKLERPWLRWRDLPKRYGNWQAIRRHYIQWDSDGRLELIKQALVYHEQQQERHNTSTPPHMSIQQFNLLRHYYAESIETSGLLHHTEDEDPEC